MITIAEIIEHIKQSIMKTKEEISDIGKKLQELESVLEKLTRENEDE